MDAMSLVIVAAALAGPADAQPGRIDPKKDLHRDVMKMAAVGPYVSSPRAVTGVLWSQSISHLTGASAVRVHVRVHKGRSAPDWRICFRDLAGREIESYDGNSPFLATGGIWSGEIPGSGAIVELVTDTSAAGLEIAVDRYLYRESSLIPISIPMTPSVIAMTQAPTDIQGWGRPVARLRFIKDGQQYVCSAFLVTQDLLLTNEHCVSTAESARSALADFGFDGPDATSRTVRVSRLEAVNASLDYAVVRLAEIPPGLARHPDFRDGHRWPTARDRPSPYG